MCIDQPPSLPALLGMATLTALIKLAGMWICVALLARTAEPCKSCTGKFLFLRDTMTLNARYETVFSAKRKSRVGAVSINEPPAFPSLFGMA